MHCYKSTGNAYERSNHMIHFNTNISVKEIGQRLCPLKRHFGGGGAKAICATVYDSIIHHKCLYNKKYD